MSNPFESLGKSPEDKKTEVAEDTSQHELVEGIFGCDNTSCKSYSNEAYYTQDQTLFWTCFNGHRSERLEFRFAG